MENINNWFSKSRVETFSDGIFAIIVTLLVLEIKVPNLNDPFSVKELYEALLDLSPKLLSWIISFMMVCVIWVNQHRLFESINYVNHKVFWLNALLLLCCSFIPFPTALVGDYIHNPLSLCFFGIIFALLSFIFVVIRLYYISRPDLLKSDINRAEFKKRTTSSIIYGPVLYVFGAAVAWLSIPWSLFLFTLPPIYFILFNTKIIEIRTRKVSVLQTRDKRYFIQRFRFYLNY